jgi:hypothetical protein
MKTIGTPNQKLRSEVRDVFCKTLVFFIFSAPVLAFAASLVKPDLSRERTAGVHPVVLSEADRLMAAYNPTLFPRQNGFQFTRTSYTPPLPARAAAAAVTASTSAPSSASAHLSNMSEADRLMEERNPLVFGKQEAPCPLRPESNSGQIRAISNFVSSEQMQGLASSVQRYSNSRAVDNMISTAQSRCTAKTRGYCVGFVKGALQQISYTAVKGRGIRSLGATGLEPIVDGSIEGGRSLNYKNRNGVHQPGLDQGLEAQGFINLRNTALSADSFDPYDAPRGAILIYRGFGKNALGHAEIRTDNGFASDYCSDRPVGGNFELVGVYVKPM